MKKYYPPHKPDYSVLFNEDDRALLAYKKNRKFRDFVANWDKDNPALLGWTLADFYYKFSTGFYQPSLF